MAYDLVIRNGTIVDGLGTPPRLGDVAVTDGVIVAVGHLGDQPAEREIDATGMLVTPGFVDLHTHYDGQAIWSQREGCGPNGPQLAFWKELSRTAVGGYRHQQAQQQRRSATHQRGQLIRYRI